MKPNRLGSFDRVRGPCDHGRMPAKTPPTPPTPPVPPVPPPAADANVPPQPNPYAAPAAPNPYAQPTPYAGAPGYVYATGPRTNVLAIVSFVASLAAVFIWFAGSLTAIITGHIALNQIKKTNEGGHGFALAGVIIGYVGLGLTALVVILYVIFFVVLVSSGIYSNSSYSN